MKTNELNVIDLGFYQETREIISHNRRAKQTDGSISDDLAVAIRDLIQRMHDANPLKKKG